MGNEMKHLILTLAILAGMAAMAESYAQWGGSNTGIRRQQTCTTYCQGTGSARVCHTTCN